MQSVDCIFQLALLAEVFDGVVGSIVGLGLLMLHRVFNVANQNLPILVMPVVLDIYGR